MKWMNEKPTEPGWYWFQRLNGAGYWVESCIEYVDSRDIEAGSIWIGPTSNRIVIHWQIDPQFYCPGKAPEQWGRWAGPIPEPSEDQIP